MKKQRNLTRKIVFTAMLSAVAGALMSLEFSIPMMPVFYKIDFSDVPAIIGIFTLGPLWGAAIEVVKLVVKLLTVGTNTMFVGEIANLVGIAFFILPIWFFYNKLGRNMKAAMVALSVSAVLRTLMACFINAFITLPMYASAMGISMNSVILAVSAANPAINNLTTFIILATVPFNLIKITMNNALGYLLYERLIRTHIIPKFVKKTAGVEG